jgi:3-dehydroquinate synthase class II
MLSESLKEIDEVGDGERVCVRETAVLQWNENVFGDEEEWE